MCYHSQCSSLRQPLRINLSRNPSIINTFPTLQNAPFLTHSDSTTSTLLEKQPGIYPFRPISELDLALSRQPSLSTDSLLQPLRPPAATRRLRIQSNLREHPASRASGTR